MRYAGKLLRGAGQLSGKRPYLCDDVAERSGHLVRRHGQAADLVAALEVHPLRQVARGQGLEDTDAAGDRSRDRTDDPHGQNDRDEHAERSCGNHRNSPELIAVVGDAHLIIEPLIQGCDQTTQGRIAAISKLDAFCNGQPRSGKVTILVRQLLDPSRLRLDGLHCGQNAAAASPLTFVEHDRQVSQTILEGSDAVLNLAIHSVHFIRVTAIQMQLQVKKKVVESSQQLTPGDDLGGQPPVIGGVRRGRCLACAWLAQAGDEILQLVGALVEFVVQNRFPVQVGFHDRQTKDLLLVLHEIVDGAIELGQSFAFTGGRVRVNQASDILAELVQLLHSLARFVGPFTGLALVPCQDSVLLCPHGAKHFDTHGGRLDDGLAVPVDQGLQLIMGFCQLPDTHHGNEPAEQDEYGDQNADLPSHTDVLHDLASHSI
ncbi:MAG TPA: hypothetical protein VMV94_06405 [Phycisphaerae bacterium]|nr:hypothetical protein [Phycisphaerae bacterium]